MRFGSLFSGIGGFDLAFERAGMECAWQCEIDKDARKVLQRHFEGVKIYDDVRTITADNAEPVDLICGGFPCQDLSIAGKRKGLAGERSGLWHEFHRILSELKPRWAIVENVPGLLSSNRGRDFAVLLSGLADIGYCTAWRVLDSQFTGVAQRRRRVFLVASLGDGSCAEVLFERESVCWDSPARGKAGEEAVGNVVPSITRSSKAGGTMTHQDVASGHVIGFDLAQITSPGNYSNPKPGDPQPPLNTSAQGMVASSITGHYHKWVSSDDLSQQHYVGVRRLTPTECERLQGFPDGWTDGQSDSARYKQLGNAVTVNVVEWIGRRIVEAK